MDKKNSLMIIPEDVLNEMEQLQVLGGESINGISINFSKNCGTTNKYCGNANCNGCGSSSEEEEDG